MEAIREIALYECEQEVDFLFSFGRITAKCVLLAEIKTKNTSGWGETLSRCKPSILRADEEVDWGEAQQLASSMIGKDPFSLEAILPPIRSDKRGNALRECMDIGLHDLVGRLSGLPVHALLGGKRRSSCPGMEVIHASTPSEMAEKAVRVRNDKGYRFVKPKLLGKIETDVEFVKEIRKAVGAGMTIVVDANEGYADLEEAVQAVIALEKAGADIIEDPATLTPEEFLEVKKSMTRARLMIDVPSRPIQTSLKIAALKAAHIINLHPNQMGGLRHALRIAAVAHAGALAATVGSCGYLGVATAAYHHLAAVLGGLPYCEENGTSITVLEQPHKEEAGMIHISDKPGLGVCVDRDKLSEITVRQAIIS